MPSLIIQVSNYSCLQAGPIEKVNFPGDQQSCFHKSYGFVEYEHKESVSFAILLLSGICIYGRPLKVRTVTKSEPISKTNCKPVQVQEATATIIPVSSPPPVIRSDSESRLQELFGSRLSPPPLFTPKKAHKHQNAEQPPFLTPIDATPIDATYMASPPSFSPPHHRQNEETPPFLSPIGATYIASPPSFSPPPCSISLFSHPPPPVPPNFMLGHHLPSPQPNIMPPARLPSSYNYNLLPPPLPPHSLLLEMDAQNGLIPAAQQPVSGNVNSQPSPLQSPNYHQQNGTDAYPSHCSATNPLPLFPEHNQHFTDSSPSSSDLSHQRPQRKRGVYTHDKPPSRVANGSELPIQDSHLMQLQNVLMKLKKQFAAKQ